MMQKKPYVLFFGVGLGLGLLALLFGARWGAPARGEKDPQQNFPPRESTIPSNPDLDVQASKLVDAGDYEGAARIYEKLIVEKPKSITIKLNLARCLLLAGKKEQVRQLLLEPAKDENLPAEDRGRLFVLLQQASLPDLSSVTRKTFEAALVHVHAGEELAKTPNEYEARPERKLHYSDYARAIELIGQVLAEAPTYFPAYWILGVAYENISRYKEAAMAYATYLRNCERMGLPHSNQTLEAEKRRIISEKRASTDADLASKVVGAWNVFYAYPDSPFPAQPGALWELLEGGIVQGQGGRCQWRVVDGWLIVQGAMGTPNEWCTAGRLRPNGSMEGLTQGIQVARCIKK